MEDASDASVEAGSSNESNHLNSVLAVEEIAEILTPIVHKINNYIDHKFEEYLTSKALHETSKAQIGDKITASETSLLEITSKYEEAARECAALRHRLQEEQDRFRELAAHLERQTETAKSRMQEEKDAADAMRKEVTQLRNGLAEKNKTSEELNKKLRNALSTNADGSLDTIKKNKELENKLVDRDAEIKLLQEQLTVAREHIKQYWDISENAEKELKLLNSEYESYKTETESKLSEYSSKIQLLEDKCSELEAELSIQATGDSANANNGNVLRKELLDAKEELKTALATLYSFSSELDATHSEISKLSEPVQKAEDKYTHEMILHSADIQTLSAVKEEMSKAQNESKKLVALTNTLRENIESEKGHWVDREKIIMSENEQLAQRLKDLNDQNSLLHDQIQALGTQLSVSHASKSLSESMNESNVIISVGEDEVKSSEELFQVVKFLRKEKDIAMAKFDILQAQTMRLKSQLEIFEKHLDDAKLALAAERERSEAVALVLPRIEQPSGASSATPPPSQTQSSTASATPTSAARSQPSASVSTSNAPPGVSTSHPAPGVSTSHPPPPGVSTTHPPPGVSTSHPPPESRHGKRRLQHRPLASKRTRVHDDEGEDDEEDMEEEQEVEGEDEEEEAEAEEEETPMGQESPGQSLAVGQEKADAGIAIVEPAAQGSQIEAISSTPRCGVAAGGGGGGGLAPAAPARYVPRRAAGMSDRRSLLSVASGIYEEIAEVIPNDTYCPMSGPKPNLRPTCFCPIDIIGREVTLEGVEGTSERGTDTVDAYCPMAADLGDAGYVSMSCEAEYVSIIRERSDGALRALAGQEPTYDSVAECVYATVRRPGKRVPPPPLPPRLPFRQSKSGSSWNTRHRSLGSLGCCVGARDKQANTLPKQDKKQAFSVFRKRRKSDSRIINSPKSEIAKENKDIESKKKRFDFTPTRDIFKNFRVSRKVKKLSKEETKSCEFLDEPEQVLSQRSSKSVEYLEKDDLLDYDAHLSIEFNDDVVADLALPQEIVEFILRSRQQMHKMCVTESEDSEQFVRPALSAPPGVVMSPKTNLA